MVTKWFESVSEVLDFARTLHASGEFEAADDQIDAVFSYFEKPWKWTKEYEAWKLLGHPETIDLNSIRASEYDDS